MILVRAPLRISFFGGGSDMPEYYEHSKDGGAVLSTAINKFMYLAINKTPKYYVKAVYDRIETVDDIELLQHDRIREVLKKYGHYRGLEVSSFCEMPTKGTGLGSSSTYTVALCKAMATINGWSESKFEVAESAYDIERNQCGDTLGKQDHYAAAFGGLNEFIFNSTGSVNVSPINYHKEQQEKLRNNLMLFYTGTTRVANDILTKQGSNIASSKTKKDTMKDMIGLVRHARDILEDNSYDIDVFGELLHTGWELKKTLSDNITNPDIDDMYHRALKAGAIGGKILGAGGGGFLLLYVPPKRQLHVKSALGNYEEFTNFDFTEKGVEVVYDDGTTRV